jgi:hypothetical protein
MAIFLDRGDVCLAVVNQSKHASSCVFAIATHLQES